jgi:hypothetical protein
MSRFHATTHPAVLWVDDDEKYPRLHQARLEEKGFQIIYTASPFCEINFRSWAADAVVTKSKNSGELLRKMTSLLQQRAR